MFVTHVECTVCGHHHAARGVLTVCVRCGQMLVVRYDLPRVAAAVTKDALRQRPPGMYRFRELVPLDAAEEPVTLGEGGTPLLALPRLAAHLGLRHLWAKDEGQNPTGTFKARGLGMATIAPAMGWFDLATLKEPYRLEGKKTMGLELAEQLGWDAPDVLVYPTGGGTGLVGIWKAYEELGEMG